MPDPIPQAPRRPRAIALIPARGGSKGIVGKNLLEFSGRPLIAWSIEAARRAPGIGRVVVTTDDRRIAEAARTAGADVPFMRPKRLAGDDTPMIEVAVHACRWLAARKTPRETVIVLLQPTSPLRTSRDIEKALALFHEKKAGSVVAMKRLEKNHPWWSFIEIRGGRVEPAIPHPRRLTARRQDLPAAFVPNGAIYAARLGDILSRKTLFVPPVHPYVMEAGRSTDIDTIADLTEARLAFEKYR